MRRYRNSIKWIWWFVLLCNLVVRLRYSEFNASSFIIKVLLCYRNRQHSKKNNQQQKKSLMSKWNKIPAVVSTITKTHVFHSIHGCVYIHCLNIHLADVCVETSVRFTHLDTTLRLTNLPLLQNIPWGNRSRDLWPFTCSSAWWRSQATSF